MNTLLQNLGTEYPGDLFTWLLRINAGDGNNQSIPQYQITKQQLRITAINTQAAFSEVYLIYNE